MKDTLIYQTLAKNSIPFLDVDYHIEVLFSFPEGSWFSPTNKENDAYGICSHLADMFLLQTRKTPVWHDGSFRGMNIEFRYKKNLDYSN